MIQTISKGWKVPALLRTRSYARMYLCERCLYPLPYSTKRACAALQLYKRKTPHPSSHSITPTQNVRIFRDRHRITSIHRDTCCNLVHVSTPFHFRFISISLYFSFSSSLSLSLLLSLFFSQEICLVYTCHTRRTYIHTYTYTNREEHTERST